MFRNIQFKIKLMCIIRRNLLFFLCISLYDFQASAQVFSQNNSFELLESDQHIANMVPIIVSGIPNEINGDFGIEKVCFSIIHPEIGDLTIKLISPDGTKVTLIHQIGSTEDHFTTTCIDDTSPAIYNGTAPYSGSFRSTLPLGQVNNGQNPNGTWYLCIYDDVPNAGSQGTFQQAQITFSAQPAMPFSYVSSELPIIQLNTVNMAINNYQKVVVDFKTYDHPGAQNHWKSDVPNFDGNALIEWQGWSGVSLPKKSFDIDLIAENGVRMDTTLLGLPAENDWVLKSEYLDKTLIKNNLVFNLFQKMGRYAPRTRFCELVLDDEYLGVYTLQEKIKRNKNRVEVDKLNQNELSFPGITGGYIYEINNTGSAFDWTSNFPPMNDATTDFNVEFRLVYPNRDMIPLEQIAYLKSYTDSFELSLSGQNYQDSLLGYRNFVDVYSFIDFMLLSEFAGNFDTYGRSFYLTKENSSDGGKLKAGPPWDFDQSFGYYIPSTSGWVWQITNYYWPFPFWWSKFWSDEQYRKEAECRWKSYRNDALSDSSILHTIDSLQQRLNVAYLRNDVVWENSGGSSMNANFDELKNWIQQRTAWIDDSLDQQNVIFPNLSAVRDTTICAGDTLRLILPIEYHYDWDPGPTNPQIVVNESGFYTLTATESTGCFTSKKIHVSLMEPDASFSIIAFEGNHSITCQALDTNLVQYVWQLDGDGSIGTDFNEFNFVKNDMYLISLVVEDAMGCTSSSTLEHLVNTIIENDLGFNFFPNPSLNEITFVVDNTLIGNVVKIMDESGKLCFEGTITQVVSKLNLPFQSGVYFIEMNGKTAKMIVV